MAKSKPKSRKGRDGWRRVVDSKLKGAYGETDFEKKTIRINKKKHKALRKGKSKSYAHLLDTIVHEEMHRKHPKMYERTVRKKTKALVPKLTKKQKKRYYSKYG